METTGVVKKTEGKKCVVMIYRSSACGENCGHSCASCAGARPISVTADNDVGAVVCDKVKVWSETARVLSLAALLYLLPLVAAALFYFFARLIGKSDDMGAAFALFGLIIGFIPAFVKSKNRVKYKLTEVINSAKISDER